MAESTIRPNIRIEIHNNLAESMDLDETGDGEEGEISDTNEAISDSLQEVTKTQPFNKQRLWPNTNGGFTTGINIFDKEEQSKLQERAKRFSLKPDEINNFTDEQLQALHDSLGITAEDEKDIRFEAIHMRGTDDMSTEDVLEYFGKYGPAAIEWIDDSSCNVLWNDKISAARALFFLSKPIKGMPVEGPCDPFAKEFVDNLIDDKGNEGRSILLRNKDREVELKVDAEDVGVEEEMACISDIFIPIPPGYWRLAVGLTKAQSILLRFTLKSDKKPQNAEKFSEYYKKYGNPNFGGLRGIITETHKKKFKGIFDRNKEIKEPAVEDPKNPWGNLALNWNEDIKYCEKEVSPPRLSTSKPKSDIMNRLGFKRAMDAEKEPTESVEKKVKIPRMRMYADEEEEKIKRKKQLQKLKSTNDQKSDDLRHILNEQSRKSSKHQIKEEDEESEAQVDLGTRLKNRSRSENHVVNIPRNKSGDEEPQPPKRIDSKRKYDGRDYLKERSRYDDYERYERRSHTEKYRRERNSSKYDRKLRSDCYDVRHISDDHGLERHKPRSKIAVVIKTQKAPTVASTVWSRMHSDRQRLKTVSERKFRKRKSSSSESSDTSSSSSSSSSSDSSSEENSEVEEPKSTKYINNRAVKTERPGFDDGQKSDNEIRLGEHRNSLRIEINNDHFKKQ